MTEDPRHPPSVMERVRAAIAHHGPISFAEFMDISLYGPGGFYERPPIGERGHFITSPHVHPVFARLLSLALRDLWDRTGRPEPFRLVEMGAGDGTLAAQLLEQLAGLPLAYSAVERSPEARVRLAGLRIRVAEGLGDLGPELEGCVLANELIDNLPFHRVRRTSEGELVELRVAAGPSGLAEVEVPAPAEVERASPQLRRGEEAAVSLEALRLIEELAGFLTAGYVLLIDYGDASGRPAGPVHGYRDHRPVGEILRQPGGTDITAGVDFAAILRRAMELGLEAHGPVTQRDALLSLGYGTWTEAERERQGELLRSGAGAEAVRTWSGRNRADLLIDTEGLGGLNWLLLATPGLDPPGWIG
jgi:NADH dehydrogenase [ubiquinone] 1 alpha subcomplex assembly factor 7